jgi:hypothetical protein
MAANDRPVPVRTLADAARLMGDARQLGQYGIKVSSPALEYNRLLARVREVGRDCSLLPIAHGGAGIQAQRGDFDELSHFEINAGNQ